MDAALRQLYDAANALADSGLRTVKTNDLCVAVYGAIDELERARAEIARLREALKTNMAIIERAQAVLCGQLMGPPHGLRDHTALNKLHRLLDGPEQREALGQARAALAEQEKK